ncbi:Molybdopterin converting factor, subunit [Gracilibacillus halophilus YIM-C55.5]|uniref:Molybdopterin synthase sulfur carrier subunit n=1 Tax=Gracilibacillus halophilus YIM-C55.5 TaxID=1308866 RepID=N4WN52_9BACI|nr:molybdopterin converting factor subunit 1 [Gracilibacillus halophilus]ENH95935.1 Molybdopterin converting factor, subunit [Gracilibacillus halophilus YIM-C55.5]
MITVLLFAQLQEEARTATLTINEDVLTVNQLKNQLINAYQLYQVNECMIAINEEYALDIDEIKPGDTVAVIPPVSGG